MCATGSAKGSAVFGILQRIVYALDEDEQLGRLVRAQDRDARSVGALPRDGGRVAEEDHGRGAILALGDRRAPDLRAITRQRDDRVRHAMLADHATPSHGERSRSARAIAVAIASPGLTRSRSAVR